MTARISTFRLFLASFALGLAATLGGPAHCQAGLILEAQNVATSPGSTGSFDIVILNTDPTTTYNVASDSVEIALSGVSGVLFTAATIGSTTAPYIYVNSGTLGPPSTPLSFDSFPNTTFIASDSEFGPLHDRAIGPGGTFGLVHVSYSVASSAVPSVGAISFLALGAGTSLSDSSTHPIPFTTQNGTFTISPAATTPEPRSILLLAIGGLGMALVGGRQSLKGKSRGEGRAFEAR